MKVHPFLALVLFIWSCNPRHGSDLETALGSINEKDLTKHVSVLAADSLEGRKPFSRGEERTVNYLAGEFRRMGLEPAFGDSYFQDVKMVEVVDRMEEPAVIRSGNRIIRFNFPDEIAVSSRKLEDRVIVSNSEMVFAGFGIVAPEYGWDDYKDLDVRGKTVVVMVNDPGLYTSNIDLFKGNTMTYYGRWTYKFEEAERQGAEGIVIIHETLGAGYPYDIPRKSSLTSNFYLDDNSSENSHLKYQGWISASAAETLFNTYGIKVDSLRLKACEMGFKGFPLNASISLEISASWEFNTSRNVAAVLEGSLHPEESIIYTAHWDHFGIGEAEDGDSIYNGAVDNGTSLAWMLEIAEAFSRLTEKPERSLVFMAPTAEEQGLLGSTWYTLDPALPVEKTLACINNDMLLPIGRMKDVMVTGYGQSELDQLVASVAEKQDRYILPDPDSHTGMYFRSDHFSFAIKGVPSLFVRGNCDSREHGKEWAEMQEDDYIRNRYHRPADNYDPETWNFSGIVEDAKMAFEIGFMLTRATEFPGWSENSEFRNNR